MYPSARYKFIINLNDPEELQFRRTKSKPEVVGSKILQNDFVLGGRGYMRYDVVTAKNRVTPNELTLING